MMNRTYFALAITGPTASGKTALSLAVAKEFGAHILSCDSMQIYRDMDIGTAKATKEERATIPHHLIDIVDVGEPFSSSRYLQEALSVAKTLGEEKIPLLFVGGTGLYLDTLRAYTLPDVPKSDPDHIENIRARFTDASGELSLDDLHAYLAEVDPVSAEKIHKNNVRRVLRAIEIYENSATPKSELDRLSREGEGPFSIVEITLDAHIRQTLYDRIDLRVDKMLGEGLLDEVRTLYARGLFDNDSTARQAIGYKEMLSYLEGEMSLEEAVETLKRSSRRYAKRQLTWFRSHKDAYVLYIDNEDGTLRSLDEMAEEAIQYFKNQIQQRKAI